MLDLARSCFASGAWQEAYDAFVAAEDALDAGDLEAMARSAYMVGRDADYVRGLDLAHRLHLQAGDIPRAVRCAFWIGHNLMFRGQAARANGWFALGVRLLDSPDLDCVERGYLLIPRWLQEMGTGDWASGHGTAMEAARLGERFGDADLVWLARDEQARALLWQGRTREALTLVDEVLVVVDSGALSPIVSGIVYCNTIAFCRDARAERQAIEWTDALTAWCDAQPQMVAHQGLCVVHRAEVMAFRGDWAGAMDAASVAIERFRDGALNQIAQGRAHNLQGELHRRRGALADAEQAYRDASTHGWEPQPGLALLRLAQGQAEASAAAIRRVVTERVDPFDRAVLLPAYVEIILAVGDTEAAHVASDQLYELAERHRTESLSAQARSSRAAVQLEEGDAAGGLVTARAAWQAWHELGAPYDSARARVLVARCCAALGDADSAELELETARATFVELGARLDLASGDDLASRAGSLLSRRELEVLRLVAAGRTNRQVATELVISEHTVARHLQNTFTKLGVSSRTEAAAVALERGLVPLPHGQH
jgi:DNA-binding CsgD family transcriptional regulator